MRTAMAKYPWTGVKLPRVVLAFAVLAVVLVVGWSAAIVRRPAPLIPLDWHIPNEQALINLGLSGAPGSYQPAQPFAVDRVLVDGAATYIQFHTTNGVILREHWLPHVYNNSGVMIDANAGVGGAITSSTPDWFLPFDLPAWFPWHPPMLQRGFISVQAALPASSRAAIIQFPFHETVRVPLNLRALIPRRVSHPGTLAHLHGVTVRVSEVDMMHLTYTIDTLRPALAASALSPVLTARAGPLQSADLGGSCGGEAVGHMQCSESLAFPPQRPGTRLTLTIPAFEIDSGPGFSVHIRRTVSGPYRLSFATP